MSKSNYNWKRVEPRSVVSVDSEDRFSSLYAGWLEARSKLVLLNAKALDAEAGTDFDERALKLHSVQDDFGRRLGAIPTGDIRRMFAKLEVAAYYAGADAPTDLDNPLLVLIAGIRADLHLLASDSRGA